MMRLLVLVVGGVMPRIKFVRLKSSGREDLGCPNKLK